MARDSIAATCSICASYIQYFNLHDTVMQFELESLRGDSQGRRPTGNQLLRSQCATTHLHVSVLMRLVIETEVYTRLVHAAFELIYQDFRSIVFVVVVCKGGVCITNGTYGCS